MKRILTLLTTLVACCFGYAQSVDVHHSGILSSYSADELQEISLEHDATGSTVSILTMGPGRAAEIASAA